MAPRFIYLLEDDSSLRGLLAEVLHEELGAHLEACATMAELQTHCATRKPDLIVADFWGSSHLTLAEAERSEITALAAIAPVVLVSARNWAQDAQASDFGLAALLVKPLDIDRFVGVARAALATAPRLDAS
jgi:DNA-binding NtrC family response regulator